MARRSAALRVVPATMAARVEVPDAGPPGRGLSPWMRDASRAFAEALFWTDEGPPPPERLDWLVEDLDDFLARSGARARFTFLLCLVAIAVVAPLLVWKLPPLHSLSAADRVEAVERAERGLIGLAVFGAKAILCVLYYEHTDAGREAGFDGTCLHEPSADRAAPQARA